MTSEQVLAENFVLSWMHSNLPLKVQQNNETTKQRFLESAPHFAHTLEHQQIIANVSDNKILMRFQQLLLDILNCNDDNALIQTHTLKLTAILVHQCPLSVREQMLLKYMEKLSYIAKHKFTQRLPLYTNACLAIRAFLLYMKWYSNEMRRKLHELLPKLLQSLLHDKSDLLESEAFDKPMQAKCPETQAAYTSTIAIFSDLFLLSPNAVRKYAKRVDDIVRVVFQSIETWDIDALTDVYAVIARTANASEDVELAWTATVEKLISFLHFQLDIVHASPTLANNENLAKAYTKRAKAEEILTDAHRAHLLLARCTIVQKALCACLQNENISQRPIEQSLLAILRLVQRAVSTFVAEVGQQSTISRDGHCLPSNVVYSILPGIQNTALSILGDVVQAAGMCAMRYTTLVGRILRTAVQSIQNAACAQLYRTICMCVQTLGASAYQKVGGPMRELIVFRMHRALAEMEEAFKFDASSELKLINNKGKKRKRQCDVSTLALESGKMTTPRIGIQYLQRLWKQIQEGVTCLSCYVLVYGPLMSIQARSTLINVVQRAATLRSEKRLLFASAFLDEMAVFYAANVATSTCTDHHGNNLEQAVQYCQKELNSTVLHRLTLSTCEALLHPRAPPLLVDYSQDLKAPPVAEESNLYSLNLIGSISDWGKQLKRDKKAVQSPLPLQEAAVQSQDDTVEVATAESTNKVEPLESRASTAVDNESVEEQSVNGEMKESLEEQSVNGEKKEAVEEQSVNGEKKSEAESSEDEFPDIIDLEPDA